MTEDEFMVLIKEIIARQSADGCEGCKYGDNEEWDPPCSMCQRSKKDYWRPKA